MLGFPSHGILHIAEVENMNAVNNRSLKHRYVRMKIIDWVREGNIDPVIETVQ